MSEKEKSDDDQWSEAWASSSDEGDTVEATGDIAEADPESGQESGQSDEDIESLKQKLRSAEGRFQKFEDHIVDLRTRLEERELAEQEEETPEEPDTFIPDGWTQEDWEDFSADNPVQAELIEKQGQQVKQLDDRLNQTEQSISVAEQNRIFNEAIHKAHPDYDDLLANERQQIVDFIEGQSNPTLKKAYQNTYESGTAEDIIELVSDYKARNRQAGSNESVSQKSVDQAMAVQGRSQSPSNINGRAGLPPEDDFSAGWNYFSDDSID